MKQETLRLGGKEYRRVTMNVAEDEFLCGENVYMIASNINPYGPMGGLFEINMSKGYSDFKSVVNSFRYYNCFNNETGKYVKFYVEVR
jgi:hypothetical protein